MTTRSKFIEVNVKNTFTWHIDKKNIFDIFVDFLIFIHFHYMNIHRLLSSLQRRLRYLQTLLKMYLLIVYCLMSSGKYFKYIQNENKINNIIKLNMKEKYDNQVTGHRLHQVWLTLWYAKPFLADMEFLYIIISHQIN
jgi:hypothetical protein